ncbi:MAG: hypothetical protein ACRET6_06785, partial [Burkholderiales bacterium]
MKDRIFIVLLTSWLAPLESLEVPSVQQPQERGTMLVDAKVLLFNPDKLSRVTRMSSPAALPRG